MSSLDMNRIRIQHNMGKQPQALPTAEEWAALRKELEDLKALLAKLAPEALTADKPTYMSRSVSDSDLRGHYRKSYGKVESLEPIEILIKDTVDES